MSFYRKARRVFVRIFRFFLNIRVTGAENIPSEPGNMIIAANHTGANDVFALAWAMGDRDICFLAKAELFRIPLLGGLLRRLGAYPVDRGHGDVAAVRRSIELLKDNKMVCIFPQGTRYKGIPPEKTTPRDGIALIARRSGASVLPVCICLKNYKYALFRRTTVIIGKPLENGELPWGSGGRSSYSEVSGYIFGRICGLSQLSPPSGGEEKQ